MAFEDVQHISLSAFIVADDFFLFVRGGAMLEEVGIPFMVVNHATAEAWGIRNLYEHTRKAFPSLPVHFFPQGCSYRTVFE